VDDNGSVVVAAAGRGGVGIEGSPDVNSLSMLDKGKREGFLPAVTL
jgi:hypothetical protein